MTPEKLAEYIDAVFDRLAEKTAKLLDVANMLAKDLSFDMPAAIEPTMRRRRKAVFLEPIYQNLEECTRAYMELCDKSIDYARQQKPALPDLMKFLSGESQKTWFQRNEVREKSSSWLNTQPDGSLERAFLWSCVKLLTLQYGVRPTTKELLQESNALSEDVTNIALDTPTNYLLKAIEQSSDLDEAITRIEQIKDRILNHFKEATRCWQDLARELNT